MPFGSSTAYSLAHLRKVTVAVQIAPEMFCGVEFRKIPNRRNRAAPACEFYPEGLRGIIG